MRIRELIYPDLKGVPMADRSYLLNRAREMPFDVIELFGMATGVVLVTAVTGYPAEDLDILAIVFNVLSNFLIALPLLAVILFPFFVRRTRRGLRTEIDNYYDGPHR